MQNVMPLAESFAQFNRAAVAPACGTGLGMMMTIITTITPQRGASG